MLTAVVVEKNYPFLVIMSLKIKKKIKIVASHHQGWHLLSSSGRLRRLLSLRNHASSVKKRRTDSQASESQQSKKISNTLVEQLANGSSLDESTASESLQGAERRSSLPSSEGINFIGEWFSRSSVGSSIKRRKLPNEASLSSN